MSSDEGENATTGISELERIYKQPTCTRSKIQHPAASMENLPDELLINIFIRLLARQLAQMRSVSKSWNALLSLPSFVKSHLHHSLCNNNQQILLAFPPYPKPFTEIFCQSLHLEPTNFIKHTPADLLMMVIGSVNGLICLYESSYSNIHIWNPSLSAVSIIPPLHSLTYKFPYIHDLRFGFDPKTDDYKLVKISGVHGRFRVKEWLQVEVYSMRKGTWEFITQPFPSHITMILDSDILCVDGHGGYLHWQIETVVKKQETYVAFDLGSETFDEIPLPHSNHIMNQLGVLGGKLCDISIRSDDVFEVWVMEEYGVPESWVKRHVFQFRGGWTYIFGFTLRNELLVLDKDRLLVLYDLVANKTKKTRTKQSATRIVEYVDSLVWV